MPAVVLIQESGSGKLVHCPVGKWLAVGRDKQSDIVFDDRSVSRRHCSFRAEPDGRLRIADRSTYGTYIGEDRVGGEAYARPGETVTLGKRAFTVRVFGLLDPDADRSHNREPAPPQRMGAHTILLQEVGRGGMGIVYEAWDESRSQRCAVKWLREGGSATPDSMARFMKEAVLQGRLVDHPGVVTVYDLGTVTGSGEMFCVMEFVLGRSLLERVRDGLTHVEAARLMARVARVVGFAHELEVVHRDLKPANVMVTEDGAVRLTDFGISKALDVGTGATVTGVMLGTPGYMAPEQILDAKNVGPAADIYALGAMLYTCLTSKLPIRGRTIREALTNASKGVEPPSPREHDPTIAEELETVCKRALAARPEDRYPTAIAMADALEAWASSVDPAPGVALRRPGA